MTAQAQQPAFPPRNAHSAETEQAATDLAGLIVMGFVWLGLSGAVGVLAALYAHAGGDPTLFLGVLALGWSIIHTTSLTKRGGRK